MWLNVRHDQMMMALNSQTELNSVGKLARRIT